METLHILTRVSTSVQEEDGTSLNTQKEHGIDLSKRLGMKYQIHNEGGTSSSKDTLDNRPVMVNLLRLMDEGVVRNLYVYNTDRISRNQSTWYLIRQKMVKNGVVLYTSNGRYDTSGTMENLILGVLSEVSQYDNKVRTERSRLGKIEKVKSNFYRGGDPPFGYRIEKEPKGSRLVVDEYESPYVQSIYQMYSEGFSVKEIKHFLELNHVKTRRDNNHWSLGSIQLILRNDTYIGIDEFTDKKSGMTIRNQIPHVISSKLFEVVQERRIRTLTRKGQINRTTKDYLFRDFMYCSCGSPIGGRIQIEKSVYHYYCPLSERKFNNSKPSDQTCNMKRCLQIGITEEFLWDNIVNLLSNTVKLKFEFKSSLRNDPNLTLLINNQKRRLQERLKRLETKLETINDGLIGVEKDKLMGNYTSHEVYEGLKVSLNKDSLERFNIPS